LKEDGSVLTVDQVTVLDLDKSSTAPRAGEFTCRAATDAASAMRQVMENCIVEEFIGGDLETNEIKLKASALK